jgi:DNA-binding response OmpR family regulator
MTSLPRVLLVDDSALVRHALARRLGPMGFDIVHAETDAEAAKVDASTVKFVVLDLELGPADGTRVAERLLAENPNVRIAFFTSGSSLEVLERARQLGPVFAKPDELDQLIAWLKA